MQAIWKTGEPTKYGNTVYSQPCRMQNISTALLLLHFFSLNPPSVSQKSVAKSTNLFSSSLSWYLHVFNIELSASLNFLLGYLLSVPLVELLSVLPLHDFLLFHLLNINHWFYFALVSFHTFCLPLYPLPWIKLLIYTDLEKRNIILSHFSFWVPNPNFTFKWVCLKLTLLSPQICCRFCVLYLCTCFMHSC